MFCLSSDASPGATPHPLPYSEVWRAASFRVCLFPRTRIHLIPLRGEATGMLVPPPPEPPALSPAALAGVWWTFPMSPAQLQKPNSEPGILGMAGRAAARSWATESRCSEAALKTRQPFSVSSFSWHPACMGRHPALHGPEAPSPPLPTAAPPAPCAVLPLPHRPGAEGGLGSVPTFPSLGPPRLAPTHACHCRILLQAPPPPHASRFPLHLLAEISVLLHHCPDLFPKDSSMLFFSQGKKKGKKKQCQQPSVREQPNSNKACVRDGGR